MDKIDESVQLDIRKNGLSGSLLTVRPGLVVPADWLRNNELCEYLKRFGVAVSLKPPLEFG